MVEFKDPNSPMEEGFDNRVFIVPAIIIIGLIGFVVYKLATSIHGREKARRDKKQKKLESRRR